MRQKLLVFLLLAASTPSWAAPILDIVEDSSPFGFVALADLGVAPFGCPSDCNDGGFLINIPSFGYAGDLYSQVIWSVNGTLEPGAGSGLSAPATNQNLPDPTTPNNIIAPLWADLDMGTDGDGAEWYIANLTAGPRAFTVFEWNNIPLFGDLATRFTFQTWIERTDLGPDPATNPHSPIWFVYSQLGSTTVPMTIGAENSDGTIGDSYFFNGIGSAPRVGTDLRVVADFTAVPVPEPSTLLLFMAGLLGLGFAKRRT